MLTPGNISALGGAAQAAAGRGAMGEDGGDCLRAEAQGGWLSGDGKEKGDKEREDRIGEKAWRPGAGAGVGGGGGGGGGVSDSGDAGPTNFCFVHELTGLPSGAEGRSVAPQRPLG